MTFSEPTPPADGAVASDDPTAGAVSLAADLVTWTLKAMAVGVGNVTYTGTSVAPDAGPAIVSPMSFSVTAAPVAETGSFNPGSATIS
jgi:hypothetical protein